MFREGFRVSPGNIMEPAFLQNMMRFLHLDFTKPTNATYKKQFYISETKPSFFLNKTSIKRSKPLSYPNIYISELNYGSTYTLKHINFLIILGNPQ